MGIVCFSQAARIPLGGTVRIVSCVDRDGYVAYRVERDECVQTQEATKEARCEERLFTCW
jgi:hypothetical protein